MTGQSETSVVLKWRLLQTARTNNVQCTRLIENRRAVTSVLYETTVLT
jgi:hypothetical protein